MHLNINTPKGQVALGHEQVLLSSIESKWPSLKVVQTPKGQPSEIDGFIIKGNEIYSVIETKTRNCDLMQMEQWGNEWLISYEKLLHGAEISARLRVPFIGFIYLVDEPIGISIPITDITGQFVQSMRLERTKTIKNINGGEVVRTNAFINISQSKTFPIIQ
jgi:hypothetical protein